MSLDFYLTQNGEQVFSRNITHNLGAMANAAGLYQVLWRPQEHGYQQAKQCIATLQRGLIDLITHRVKYEEFNSPNGWGMYEHFVLFVTAVLTACADYPEATVSVCV